MPTVGAALRPVVLLALLTSGAGLRTGAALRFTVPCSSLATRASSCRAPLLHRRAPPPAMLAPQDVIDSGVSLVTFAPQFLWILLIAAPRAGVTKTVMGGILPLAAFSLVHLAIVVLAASQDQGTAPILLFNEVFNPSNNQLDKMMELFAYRNFAAEELEPD